MKNQYFPIIICTLVAKASSYVLTNHSSQINASDNVTIALNSEWRDNQSSNMISSAVVVVGSVLSLIFCVAIFHLLYNDVNFLPNLRSRRRV